MQSDAPAARPGTWTPAQGHSSLEPSQEAVVTLEVQVGCEL